MTNQTEEIRIMSLPKMQEKFREAMGLIQLGDLCLYRDDVFIVTDKDDYYKTVCLIRLKVSEDEANEFWPTEKSVIHLPLALDYDGPDGRPSERCLWGMVDWAKFTCSPNDDGTLDIYERYEGGYDEERLHYWNESPYLALLKALAAQWEVEVKE